MNAAGRRPIVVIQGGQWGSEGKGQVAAAVAARLNYRHVVRTGSINAGHTVYYKGEAFKMQQLPTAWVNPDALLYIGPGAYIEPAILAREVKMVSRALGVSPDDFAKSRLLIDYRAGLHLPEYGAEAGMANRHVKIGATGKGCAEAIIHKIKDRGNGGLLFRDSMMSGLYDLVDVPLVLNDRYDEGAGILLEGTQGTHLDMHLGPYPYTTSRMTTAANWAAEAGLSPSLDYQVILVLRTYPIRVAGNSGPMPGEISWPILARAIRDRQVAMSPSVPKVSEEALQAFERAVELAAAGWDLGGLNPSEQFNWSDEDRVRYAGALSEINSAALSRMSLTAFEEVTKLFEFTTVTKKLRRIATFDTAHAKIACRIERPAGFILSFLNYLFPETWGLTENEDVSSESQDVVSKAIKTIETSLGTPCFGATTGPLQEHVLLDGNRLR